MLLDSFYGVGFIYDLLVSTINKFNVPVFYKDHNTSYAKKKDKKYKLLHQQVFDKDCYTKAVQTEKEDKDYTDELIENAKQQSSEYMKECNSQKLILDKFREIGKNSYIKYKIGDGIFQKIQSNYEID